ncbi:MAG: glycosyltransferase family 39 protein, partial [Thermoplasmata archaeon]
AVTDLNGTATFLDVPPGVWRVAASLFRPPGSGSEPLSLLVADLAAVPPASTPYRTRLAIVAIDGAQVTVRVEDVFGTPLPGTSITLARKTPQGLANVSILPTDGDGRSAFIVPGTGDYVFAGSKPGLGRGIVAPSVVRVDGRYYVVNRWAPGYQILLGLSLQTDVEDSLTVLLMVAAAASVYLLARRLFEWRVAFLAATLLVTCTLALIMVFLAGMADYASMTFALLGLSLFVEGLDGDPKRFREALLLLASGIAFGVAVWMRYSTVTLGVAPAAYLVVRALSEWRAASPRSLVPPLKRLVRRGAPFLIGLFILGLPLAAYNVTYFGSPLAAGYNFGTLQVVGEGEDATAQLTSGSFYENFNPSAALGSAPLRLAWLVALAPFVLVLPVAVLRHWRRLPTHLLLWTFLANFLLYIFVPWVATWASSPVRSMEDMRYFLPGIPSAAVLAALVLRGEIAEGGWRKWLAIALVVAFVAAGFAGAALGIGLQLARLQPLPGGPVP